MGLDIVFDPLLPWPIFLLLCALAAVPFAAGAYGLRWWSVRAGAAVLLVVAIANPSLKQVDREILPNIVLLGIDRTSSQSLGDRAKQIEVALISIRSDLAELENIEIKEFSVEDSSPESGYGTELIGSLQQSLADVDASRVASAILVTDGQAHDADYAPTLSFPVHALITGNRREWDRRLHILNAPSFAVVGEPVSIFGRVDDEGSHSGADQTLVSISGNSGESHAFTVPVGKDFEIQTVMKSRGMNVFHLETDAIAGELTALNNSATLSINAVRDRLKVLLVSGKPHAGKRTWRNILKSDSSVELVHFTILRPAHKSTNASGEEMALIEFPIRELFIDKIHEFDLIIFDKYHMRGIIPLDYLLNIREYVRKGGGLLVAAGPEFSGPDSLYNSLVFDFFPAEPTGLVVEEGFLPETTDLGRKHPVTANLPGAAEIGKAPSWGRWFRMVDLVNARGDVLLAGPGERPLLVLDRFGEGRVSLLASDQVWLWHRKFEGGGPQQELLRRLAHWMMKEPELEEERLSAEVVGNQVRIARKTLNESADPVHLTSPDGNETRIDLEETVPGLFESSLSGLAAGRYHIDDGAKSAIVLVGADSPEEFRETIATGEKLSGHVERSGGGVFWVEDGVPDARIVRDGSTAVGEDWLGIVDREKFATIDIHLRPIVHPLAFLFLASVLAVFGWWREN